MTDKFNGVPWDAPLFRKTELDTLNEIVECLSRASYHFADDSAKEWGYGSEQIKKAAALCNSAKLDFDAVSLLVAHKPQLVTTRDLINAMLSELRK